MLSRGGRVNDVEERRADKECELRRTFRERLKQDSYTAASGDTLYINEHWSSSLASITRMYMISYLFLSMFE